LHENIAEMINRFYDISLIHRSARIDDCAQPFADLRRFNRLLRLSLHHRGGRKHVDSAEIFNQFKHISWIKTRHCRKDMPRAF
jgi:hypothetical protein